MITLTSINTISDKKKLGKSKDKKKKDEAKIKSDNKKLTAKLVDQSGYELKETKRRRRRKTPDKSTGDQD